MPERTGRALHAWLDPEEDAALDAEVARRQAVESTATITRAGVARYLVRTHLCATPGAASTEQPENKKRGAHRSPSVSLSEPVEDAEGTRPVRGKAPNPLGLHDMLGNVYEWCSDVYGPYEAGRQVDPRGPEEGSFRVIRGGSWSSVARLVRAADRGGGVPRCRFVDLGFRLARGQQV